jgi:acyl-CoA dehydrogenase
MNLEPTEEQRQIVATVRRFVREEIVPLEDKLDPDASELPPEDFARLTKQVRDMGFWGLDIPAEYGGAGVDLVTRTLMAVEMAQHRAGLYVPCYGVFGSAGLAQLY